LRSTEDIDKSIALAEGKKADAVVSVCPTHDHPYLSKRVAEDGRLSDFVDKPQGYLARQKLTPAYSLNGAIYLVRRSVLMERDDWYTERTFAYIMPPERSLDIDTPWDLHLVELILRDTNGFTND
jgi:N-acylneuraminate cytidylyltransferase/CMP-N,N'-diacetyllegionaminic acid synthase